ncbi:MAG: hypothetical protein KC656_35930, partial [Myxococcales bacterium]|nr:hypothetical protein [Myxococcales bacterium]
YTAGPVDRSDNGTCEDGGAGSTAASWPLGTDCTDCGPRDLPAGTMDWDPNALAALGAKGQLLCADDTFGLARDGTCDVWDSALPGDDCTDCGPVLIPDAGPCAPPTDTTTITTWTSGGDFGPIPGMSQSYALFNTGIGASGHTFTWEMAAGCDALVEAWVESRMEWAPFATGASIAFTGPQAPSVSFEEDEYGFWILPGRFAPLARTLAVTVQGHDPSNGCSDVQFLVTRICPTDASNPPPRLCDDTCPQAGDGACNDDGISWDFGGNDGPNTCATGTDCTDCGVRYGTP